MAATVSTDWNFQPKVWQDHIDAYFDNKLVFGALALRDDTLKSSPGETVNFPYFETIGAAEEPLETGSLTVDNLADDSFSATVKEVGKAIGAKDKAFIVSAARRETIVSQGQSQMGRVLAEKVDADLITEINTPANHEDGFVATLATDNFTVTNMNIMLTSAFGDRMDETVAIFIHSQHHLSLMNDPTTGFLKADATDPMFGLKGFKGRLLGAAVIVADTMPAGAVVSGKATFHAFAVKANAYGIINKKDLNPEQDRDILARETIWSATMWYAVKAFHAKIDAEDKKIARGLFTVL